MLNALTWDSFAAMTLHGFTDRYGPPVMESGEARWSLRDAADRPVVLSLGRRAGSPDGFARLSLPNGELLSPIHDGESLRRWHALVLAACPGAGAGR